MPQTTNQSSAIALLAAAAVVLAVGFYTDNGGFQLAGAIFLLVGVIVGLRALPDRKSAS